MARYFTRLWLVKYLAISHADSCNKSYIYDVTLGRVTYRGRDSINMNGGRGIPARESLDSLDLRNGAWLCT